jgi:hypothetical protein
MHERGTRPCGLIETGGMEVPDEAVKYARAKVAEKVAA